MCGRGSERGGGLDARLGWAPEVREAAAAAEADAAADVAGRRSRRVTFRRAHAAVARRGANGQLGDIKSLSWSAGRLRRAAVAPADIPVAGAGWQTAPDGLEYTAVPERRWAKRTPTDTSVVLVNPGDMRPYE